MGGHSSEVIRLYVGTDPQQFVAERALEASVRRNTTLPVLITWMRQGDPGWDWGGMAAGWATPFSMFRWAVPEACRTGRAIYLDVDMIVLGDLAELWRWDIPAGRCGMFAGRMSSKADVILWDCGVAPRWSRCLYTGRQAEVRREGAKALHGCQLPPEWDHVDTLREDTKILHMSKLSQQCWKPYPERYDYEVEHRDQAACAKFWEYANA